MKVNILNLIKAIEEHPEYLCQDKDIPPKHSLVILMDKKNKGDFKFEEGKLIYKFKDKVNKKMIINGSSNKGVKSIEFFVDDNKNNVYKWKNKFSTLVRREFGWQE